MDKHIAIIRAHIATAAVCSLLFLGILAGANSMPMFGTCVAKPCLTSCKDGSLRIRSLRECKSRCKAVQKVNGEESLLLPSPAMRRIGDQVCLCYIRNSARLSEKQKECQDQGMSLSKYAKGARLSDVISSSEPLVSLYRFTQYTVDFRFLLQFYILDYCVT